MHSLPDSPSFTCATVWVGLSETCYRRAGRGHPVVVLGDARWDAADPILAALARHFLVVVPAFDLPRQRESRPRFAARLSSFLDGLGLASVALVADERFGAAALGAAMAEPDRIEQVAIVLDGTPLEGLRQPVGETLAGAGTRIWVGWSNGDVELAASEVVGALRQGARAVD